MISVHEKYGEVVSFPTPSGTVIFMRGNEEVRASVLVVVLVVVLQCRGAAYSNT